MNLTEILIVVGGLAVGYWVVSFFMRPGPGTPPAPPPPPEEKGPAE